MFAEGSDKEVILSDAKMTVNAVEDVEGRYLSLEVDHQILQPGQDLKTTLRDITPPNSARPTFFYLLVDQLFNNKSYLDKYFTFSFLRN